MGRTHALGWRCATRLAGTWDVGRRRHTVGRPARLGRWLGLGSAARMGLGRLGLGPGGSRRRDGRRNWRGGRLALVLLPVAAGMEPVGMGLLAVRLLRIRKPAMG